MFKLACPTTRLLAEVCACPNLPSIAIREWRLQHHRMKKRSEHRQWQSKARLTNSLWIFQSERATSIINRLLTLMLYRITKLKMRTLIRRYHCWGRSSAIWRPLSGCSSSSSWWVNPTNSLKYRWSTSIRAWRMNSWNHFSLKLSVSRSFTWSSLR